MDDRQKWIKSRELVSESLATNMDLYGINHSVGRLYAALFFHHEPMTLEDMVEDLGMSKTSMSTGVRTLLEANMVNKVWKKGVRKDLYEVESDWYQNFIDYFRTHWRKAVKSNVDSMSKCLQILSEIEHSQELTEEEKHLVVLDQDKLNEALNYYDWLGRFIDFLEGEKVFEYVPKRKKADS